MHNFILKYKHYIIAVIIVLIIIIISSILFLSNCKNTKAEGPKKNKSSSESFPEGNIYNLADNKLITVPLTENSIISSFEQAVSVASILDGTKNIDILSNDVKYITDSEKKISFYKVNSKLFSKRDELIKYTNSFFSNEYTSELCNTFCNNNTTGDTIYTFTDFDNKLYVINGHLINTFEYDYAGYKNADKSYIFITKEDDKIVFKLNITFKAASMTDKNDIKTYHTSYNYTYSKNDDNIWLLTDYYSPIALCNDAINYGLTE